MEIRLLEKNKKQGLISFFIKGVSTGFVNNLRKTIMDETPTMAIEEIEFRKNTSILYDEIIAHRLGLIPLKTDLKSYELPESKEDIELRKAKNTLILLLKAKGPCLVTASMLESKDPKVVPVYPEMSIAKLLKGQELVCECVAILGKAKEHSKWSPGLVWHTYKPSITVNNKSKKFDKFKDKYPPKIFDKSGKIDKNFILDNNLVDACDGVCDDIVKVSYDDTSFIFNVESFGQLGPKEMVTEAVKIMDSKLDEFGKLIGKVK